MKGLKESLCTHRIGGLVPIRGLLNWVLSREGWWVLMDHLKSKKHEGLAVYNAIASNGSKKSQNC